MQYPFRNPVYESGDGDPPEWTPPSYAQASSDNNDNSNEEWKPPSYAKSADVKEEKKPSVFSKVIDAVAHPKPFHPDGRIQAAVSDTIDKGVNTVKDAKHKMDEFLGDVISDKSNHPMVKRLLTSQEPGKESILPKTSEVGIKEPTTWGGGFLKGLYDEFVRPLATAEGAAGAIALGGSEGESAKSPEPSIRSPRELSGEVPADLPLPREESLVRQPLKSNIEKLVAPIEKAEGEIIPAKSSEGWKPLKYAEPINPKDVPREFVLPEDEAAHNVATEDIKPQGLTDDKIFDLARNKQNMAQDLPLNEEQKPNFTNPFEKSKIETAPEAIISKEQSLASDWTPPNYAEPSQSSQSSGEELPKNIPDDGLVEMHGGLGGIKPSSRVLEPNKGPYGAALDKLFNSMGNIKEARVTQDTMNKTERANRFANFSNVKDEGVIGASKSLSTLKGEFDKVDYDKLKMTPPQVDSLFTAVKRANITSGEKARGYTALFKLFNGEQLPARSELKILDDVFGNNFADKITEMHGGLGAVGLKLSKVANTMKSMQNAISLAAPLRHGIGLVARKEFYPAFTDMFKFFANKEYYDAGMQAIEERPNYLLGREGGLFLSKPNSLMGAEEEFLNSYVGDIPGVRSAVGASQRAYTGFLNKLRADTFDSMIKQAKELGHDVGDGENPTDATKAIARYINNATGRGSLGSLNKITNELNLALWSPRMISSRINMLANPKIYTDLPQGMRLDGLKSLLGIAALGTAIDTLGAYGGAKVSSNILSTDYGKSRFGTHLIDPWGGFQQYIVAAARFLAGKTDSSQPTNRLEIAGNFMKNKESPAVSLAHNLLTAKFTGKSDDPNTAGNMTTQYGEKTSIQSQIGKQFTPIFIQDLIDLAKREPDWADNIGLNTALGIASLAGMSQDYPEKKKGNLFRKLKTK